MNYDIAGMPRQADSVKKRHLSETEVIAATVKKLRTLDYKAEQVEGSRTSARFDETVEFPALNRGMKKCLRYMAFHDLTKLERQENPDPDADADADAS